MGMKRGNLVKLKYDFDTSKCVQIKLDSKDKWIRITEREFRSYNGERRIVTWDKQNNPIYNKYEGPIYYFGTNIVAKHMFGPGVQYIHDIKPEFKRTLSESYRTFQIKN
jgi:hypothetical protein